MMNVTDRGLQPAFSLLRVFGVSSFVTLAAASAALPSLAQAQQTAFSADCLIEASRRVELGASVAGLLTKVLVDRGDPVKAGEILAELDSRVERASLELARARAENDHEVRLKRSRLEFLTRKSERITKLSEVNAAPESSRDESETEQKLAQQELEEAELNLYMAQLEVKRSEALVEQRLIRSPFDGVVEQRVLSPGAYLHDQAHVLTIIQIDPLYVEVYLPLELFGNIKVGDHAAIRPESPAGGAFEAKVIVVDPYIDAASGTFGVRLTLDNADRRVAAGLRCKASFGIRAARPQQAQ